MKMNDEPLPPVHGYPARLIVPGLYGYVSATKWLSELELTTLEAFDGYWVPLGWAKEAPILTQSRIDTPRGGVERRDASRSPGSPGPPTAASRKVEVGDRRRLARGAAVAADLGRHLGPVGRRLGRRPPGEHTIIGPGDRRHRRRPGGDTDPARRPTARAAGTRSR